MVGVGYVEDKPIALPNIIDGPLWLGELWNCYESKLVGHSLFADLVADDVEWSPDGDFDYKLTHIKSTKDRIRTVNVEGELSLDLLSGIIKVEGAAHFDSKETSNTHEEELLCHYKERAFRITTKDRVRAKINPLVQEKILKGEIQATHVVTTVILGADISALLTIRDTSTSSKTDVGGSFMGKLAFGHVNAQLKMKLGFLDSEDAHALETRITVKGRPAVEAQPKSVQDLFDVVDSIGKTVKSTVHPIFAEAQKDVYGSPIGFILVPIKNLLEVKLEMMYLALKDDVLDRLTEMFVTIRNVEQPSFIRKQVLEEKPALKLLLWDSANQFTADVCELEKVWSDRARRFRIRAAEMLSGYKIGERKVEDMLTLTTECSEQFNKSELLMRVMSFVEIGEKDLNAIAYGNIPHGVVSIFTKSTVKQEWMDTGREIKVLLQSSTDCERSGDFAKMLYDIAVHLQGIKIKTGVALSNIQSPCPSVTVTIKTFSNEETFPADRILEVVEVLRLLANRISPEMTQFFTVYASIEGIRVPLTRHIEDILSLIQILKPIHGLFFASSYLIIKAQLAKYSENGRYAVVIPMDSKSVAVECVNTYRHLKSKLGAEADFIIGTFDLPPSSREESPLAIFYKSDQVECVCLSSFDVNFLVFAIERNDLMDNLQCLQPTRDNIERNFWRHPARANFVIAAFCNSSSDVRQIQGGHDQAFYYNSSKLIDGARKLLDGCLNIPFDKSVCVCGLATLALYENGRTVKAVLEKLGWNSQLGRFSGLTEELEKQMSTFIKEALIAQDPVQFKIETIRSILRTSPDIHAKEIERTDVLKIVADLQNSEETPQELKQKICSIGSSQDSEIYFKQLKQTLDTFVEKEFTSNLTLTGLLLKCLDTPTESAQDTILRHIIPVVISSVISSTGQSDERANSLLLKHLEDERYYHLLNKLTHLRYSSVTKITELLDNVQDFSEASVIKFFETLSDFKLNDNQHQVIFDTCQVKWMACLGLENSKILEAIRKAFCFDRVPKYLPSSLAKKLTPLSGGVGSPVTIPERINSAEELFNILIDVKQRKAVPDALVGVILNALVVNAELRHILNIEDPLYYWNAKEGIFMEAFTLRTVDLALAYLHKWKQSKAPKRPNPEPDPNASFSLEGALKSLTDYEHLEFKTGPATQNGTGVSLMGTNPQIVGQREFMQIFRIIKESDLKLSLKEPVLKQLLPFLLQRLKMWGFHLLDAAQLEGLLPKDITPTTSGKTGGAFRTKRNPGTTNINKDEPNSGSKASAGEKSQVALSKIDILASLFSICDALIYQDMMRIMSFFPVVLPFIIRDLRKEQESYVSLASLQKTGVVKWETLPGHIMKNQLFVHPFKMIVAIRASVATSSKSGKSTILNQLLKSSAKFSSKNIAGANRGIPATLSGTVEIVPLTKETCADEFWICTHGQAGKSLKEYYSNPDRQELVILANLHGNALDHPDILQYLKTITSCFILFLMPGESSELTDAYNAITACLGCDPFDIFAVDPTAADLEISNIIHTNDLVNTLALDPLRGTICDAAVIAETASHTGTTLRSEKLSVYPELHTGESERLLGIMKQHSCTIIKRAFHSGGHSDRDLKDIGDVLARNGILKDIIVNFMSILQLPLAQRKIAFDHLDKEISIMSASETDASRRELASLQESRKNTLTTDITPEILAQREYLDEQIRRCYIEIEEKALGMEHIYRKLGSLYQVAMANPTSQNNKIFSTVAKSYAELVSDGCFCEVLDGDVGDINGIWFNGICHSICDRYPKLRVFVLSILGLQSSGKSTLLNALFACKFAVSVGRCTRGLFMRLLFLEDKMVAEFGFDAILILDTEGLGAPEKMNDPDAGKKDRQLATFAMSISDLTIINMLGESMDSLTEILQIVIVAMARLDQAKITPDILLVQHLPERDVMKVTGGSDQFCKALQEAIELTEKQDMSLGIRGCDSLKKLINRVQDGHFFKRFRPFKDGAAANSPPSAQYLEDVLDLYENILRVAKDNKLVGGNARQFHSWHEMIDDFWDALQNQEFSLRFRCIKDIYEFIDRGAKINHLKGLLDNAIDHHRESCETVISAKLRELENEKFQNWEQEKFLMKNIVENRLAIIPFDCRQSTLNRNNNRDAHCDACEAVISARKALFEEVAGKPHEEETKKTIVDYLERSRKETANILDQWTNAAKVRCSHSEKLEEIIYNKILSEKGSEYSEDKVKSVWEEVLREASGMCKVVSVTSIIPDEIRADYMNDHDVMVYVNELDRFCPDLTNMNAITLTKGFISSTRKLINWMPDAKLDTVQSEKLMGYLRALPEATLRQRRVEVFQPGMILQLKTDVNQFLVKFEKTALKSSDHILESQFKWAAHNFALHHFYNVMLKKEKQWKKTNDPLCILMEKASSYKEMIKIRLRDGFGWQAEGRIIFQLLHDAMLKRAERAASREHVRSIAGVAWLTSSETVRLKYFSKLAEEVNNGNNENAMAHFRNPRKAVENWFHEQLDRFHITKAEEMYKKTFESELQSIEQMVRNSSDFLTLKSQVDEYLSGVGDSSYRPQLSTGGHDYQLCQSSLKTKLEELIKHLQIQPKVELASESDELKKLVGCTAYCPLCTGLCWGNAGHEMDSGETAEHHTCHQPMGLARCNFSGSNRLVGKSCDQNTDQDQWRPGNEAPFMPWPKFIQLEKNRGWKYEGHNKRHFNDLMKWFFLKLHRNIASESGYQPANDNEVNSSLNYSQIMATINSKLAS